MLNFPVISIVLFAVALLGLLYICFVYLYCMRVVWSCRRRCNLQTVSDDVALPTVSVVVCTRNDAQQLSANLPAILNQQFPGSYEVIVVNDGTPDDTDIVVTRLKAEFPNLYLTFVPDSTRNISRKKLAIQLGVKAAKGEVVVITDASAQVASDQWLKEMVAPFVDPDVEVALGYNYLNMPQRSFRGRLSAAFDCAADAVAWLSSAILHKPYRGCASNIAYRRELYFRNNGFHSSFNLRYGEDDLFVNEITRPDNTVVVLSDRTLGRHGADTGTVQRYRRHRLRHAFTGRTLPKASRRIMAFGEWLMWIVPLCALLGAFLAGVNNIWGWVNAGVLILAMLIVVTVAWRKTILTLSGPKMLLSIPLLAAFRPLRNAFVSFASRSSNNHWYTWQ